MEKKKKLFGGWPTLTYLFDQIVNPSILLLIMPYTMNYVTTCDLCISGSGCSPHHGCHSRLDRTSGCYPCWWKRRPTRCLCHWIGWYYRYIIVYNISLHILLSILVYWSYTSTFFMQGTLNLCRLSRLLDNSHTVLVSIFLICQFFSVKAEEESN